MSHSPNRLQNHAVFIIGIYEEKPIEDALYIKRIAGNRETHNACYIYEPSDSGWKAVRFLYDMLRKLYSEDKYTFGVFPGAEQVDGTSYQRFTLSEDGYSFYSALAIWRSGLESAREAPTCLTA